MTKKMRSASIIFGLIIFVLLNCTGCKQQEDTEQLRSEASLYYGFDICRELRHTLKIPIIMITAKKEDIDKIRGLGFGADDYLVKPFSPMELIARVKSHLYIHKLLLEDEKEEQEITYGSLRILSMTASGGWNLQEQLLR